MMVHTTMSAPAIQASIRRSTICRAARYFLLTRGKIPHWGIAFRPCPHDALIGLGALPGRIALLEGEYVRSWPEVVSALHWVATIAMATVRATVCTHKLRPRPPSLHVWHSGKPYPRKTRSPINGWSTKGRFPSGSAIGNVGNRSGAASNSRKRSLRMALDRPLKMSAFAG